MADKKPPDAWAEQLFHAGQTPKPALDVDARREHGEAGKHPVGPLWVKQLFRNDAAHTDTRLEVLKQGAVIDEFDLHTLRQQAVIGRHPQADVQLEASKISMFHAALVKNHGGYFIEDLGSDSGTLLNGKKLPVKKAAPLFHDDVVEISGYQLRFTLPEHLAAPTEQRPATGLTEALSIATPNICPLHSHLIEERDKLGVWTKGTQQLKVADIIDETSDTKTFRLIGTTPLLFSYRPGQFVTLLLTIDGQEVQRSYSMSSSPSRPHCLELTVKRVPGGLVSNWLCDNIKLGDTVTVRGPGGKFTCFDYPSRKLLFIGAGSGVTPLMSMCRWIADTAADIDVKFLISAKAPAEIIFRKDLELLSARHNNFRLAITVTSNWSGTEAWTGFTGRIDQHLVNAVVPDFQERHVFLCGPEQFQTDIKALLLHKGFPMHNFHSESFGGGRVAHGTGQAQKTIAGQYRIRFAASNVTGHGDACHTLLELAEMHGIEIDYSCRAGYCGECKVKCRGKVQISSECDLTPTERQAGYIYACCARAQSDIEIEA